jgi:hypothetical protein
MSWTLSHVTEAQRAELIAKIDGAGLGGVILSLGSAADAAALTAEVQRHAAIPLLCAGDFEASTGASRRSSTST